MKSRKSLFYAAIAAVSTLVALLILWQTIYGQLIIGLLWDDVVALRPIFLIVSLAGGFLGAVLGKLAGGSGKKGFQAGCWFLPLLLLLFRLVAIIAFLMSPGAYSFMN